MARRYDIDWEQIERDYRLGLLTIRQVAEKHKVDVSAITRRAKKGAWSRDLSAQVHAAHKAKVAASLSISNEVDAKHTAKHFQSTQADALAVELSSNKTFDLVLSHQKDTTRLKKVMFSMLARLEDQARDAKSTKSFLKQ